MKASFGLAAAAAAALLLSACNQTETATDQVGDTAEGVAGAAGDLAADASDAVVGAAGVAETPAEFVDRAAVSGLYEVEAAQLAQTKSRTQAVKDLAQVLIRDHQAANERLQSIAQSAGLTVPTALDQRHRGLIENLQEADAEEFDERFLDQQTQAHQDAITLFRGFAERGTASPALQQFASQTAPTLESHLAMTRKLDEAGADEQPAAAPTTTPPPG